MDAFITQITISDDSYLPKFLVDEEYWYPKVWKTESDAVNYQNYIIDSFINWMKNDISADPQSLVYSVKSSKTQNEIKKYVDIHYGDAIFEVMIIKKEIQEFQKKEVKNES